MQLNFWVYICIFQKMRFQNPFVILANRIFQKMRFQFSGLLSSKRIFWKMQSAMTIGICIFSWPGFWMKLRQDRNAINPWGKCEASSFLVLVLVLVLVQIFPSFSG